MQFANGKRVECRVEQISVVSSAAPKQQHCEEAGKTIGPSLNVNMQHCVASAHLGAPLSFNPGICRERWRENENLSMSFPRHQLYAAVNKGNCAKA